MDRRDSDLIPPVSGTAPERSLRVQLRAGEVIVWDGRTVIATHERSASKGVQVLDSDHSWRSFWAAIRKTHGDAAGTRVLVDVLLLHRHIAAADGVAGLTAALSIGASLTDVAAVEARKAADRSVCIGPRTFRYS